MTSLPSNAVISTSYNAVTVTQTSNSAAVPMPIIQTGVHSKTSITTSSSHHTIVKSSSIASTAELMSDMNTSTSHSVSVSSHQLKTSVPQTRAHILTTHTTSHDSTLHTPQPTPISSTSNALSHDPLKTSVPQTRVYVLTTHTTSHESTLHSPQPTPISPTSGDLSHDSLGTSDTVPQTTHTSFAFQSSLSTKKTLSPIEHTQTDDSQSSLLASELATSTMDVIPTTSRVQNSADVQLSTMWYVVSSSVSVLTTEIPLDSDSKGGRKVRIIITCPNISRAPLICTY